jgi:serine/threonine protein kinase
MFKDACIKQLEDKALVKLETRIIQFIKNNQNFSDRIGNVYQWDRIAAKEFIKLAKAHLHTLTIANLRTIYGLHFGSVLFENPSSIIQEVSDTAGFYYGKIGSKSKMKNEYDIGNRVKGKCVMPIHRFIELEDDKGIIICPKYNQTLFHWAYLENEDFVEEKELCCVLLCMISAIHSFAQQGLCHGDIKGENIMFAARLNCVLIDFGSAAEFGGFLGSRTPGMGFDYFEPSIRYDINSLAITIVRIALKDSRKLFAGPKIMMEIMSQVRERYPVVLEMLKLMRINEDIGSTDELFDIWKSLYRLFEEKYPVDAQLDQLIPPSNLR